MFSCLKLFLAVSLFIQAINYVSNQTFDNDEKVSLEKAVQIRNERLRKVREAKVIKEEALKYIPPSTRSTTVLKEGSFTTLVMEYDGCALPLYILLIALVPLLMAQLFRQVWNLVRPKLKFRREGGGEFPFTACYHLQEGLREKSLKRIARNCTSWFVHQYILAIEDETLEWNDVIESLQPKEIVTKKQPWQILRLIFRLKNTLQRAIRKDSEEGIPDKKITHAQKVHPLFTGNYTKCDIRRQSNDDPIILEEKISKLASQYEMLDTMEREEGEVVGITSAQPPQPHPQLFTVKELMEYMTRDEKLLILRCFEKPEMNEVMIYCNIQQIRQKHAEFVNAHTEAIKKMNAAKKEKAKRDDEKVVEILFKEKDKLEEDIHNSNEKLINDWEQSKDRKLSNVELPPSPHEKEIIDDTEKLDAELKDEAEPKVLDRKYNDLSERIDSLIKEAENNVRKAKAKKARTKRSSQDESNPENQPAFETEQEKTVDHPIPKENSKPRKRKQKIKKIESILDMQTKPMNDDALEAKNEYGQELRHEDKHNLKHNDQYDFENVPLQNNEPKEKLQISNNQNVPQPDMTDEAIQTHHHHHHHQNRNSIINIPNSNQQHLIFPSDKNKDTSKWVENMAEFRTQLVKTDDHDAPNEENAPDNHLRDTDIPHAPVYPHLTQSQEKTMKTDLIFTTTENNPQVKIYSQGRREKFNSLLDQDHLSNLHASQLIEAGKPFSLQEHDKKLLEAVALIENAKLKRQEEKKRRLSSEADILAGQRNDNIDQTRAPQKERRISLPRQDNNDVHENDRNITQNEDSNKQSKPPGKKKEIKKEKLEDDKKQENIRNNSIEEPTRKQRNMSWAKKEDTRHFLLKKQKDISDLETLDIEQPNFPRKQRDRKSLHKRDAKNELFRKSLANIHEDTDNPQGVHEKRNNSLEER